MPISYKNSSTVTDFIVVDGGKSLLSYKTAEELCIIKVIQQVAHSQSSEITKLELQKKFPQVFTGLGRLKDREIKLNIDETVCPVRQQHYRIPFHLRQLVAKELDYLESLGVIEKVGNRPTPWISPIVAPPRPNDPSRVRICVDMRAANSAI